MKKFIKNFRLILVISLLVIFTGQSAYASTIKVAICGTGQDASNYVSWLNSYGVSVSYVDSSVDPSDYNALVIPGGADVTPSLYGETNTSSWGCDISYDNEQLAIIDKFVKSGKGVLGICRGAQILNVYFGGSLYQDVADHRTSHYITTTAGTVARSVCGSSAYVVSTHHQAAKVIGTGLTVTGTAYDGVVEFLEHESLPVIGVQWHPELMTSSTSSDNLMRYFLNNMCISTRSLKKGMSGSDVMALQMQLYELNYLTAEPDGTFGSLTEAAVKEFQAMNGISNPDGIVGSLTRNKLLNDPIAKNRLLKKGMSGNDVLAIQQQLYELHYLTATPDGVFGSMTEAAVKEFQSANGLKNPDGMVGNWTRAKLADNPIAKVRTLKKGMSGNDVLEIQKQLYYLGYLTATPDGSFGSLTEAAVKEFQSANGLENPDGMVGNWTRAKLADNPVAKVRVLEKGMTGNDVLEVQQHLSELGYFISIPDGTFDDATEAAVIDFQTVNGHENPDGIVDSWTRDKLYNDPIAKPIADTEVDTTDAGTGEQQETEEGFDQEEETDADSEITGNTESSAADEDESDNETEPEADTDDKSADDGNNDETVAADIKNNGETVSADEECLNQAE